jgi:hypothetical protein
MEYTDEELLNWWASLSRHAQKEILEVMVSKMHHSSYAQSLMTQFENRITFSARQIATIRKWDT